MQRDAVNEKHGYFSQDSSLNAWVMCLGLMAGSSCLYVPEEPL